MNTRPKNTDSEKDIEEMQAAFFKEKETNSSFQPAAKVVKIKKKIETTEDESQDVDDDEGASSSDFDVKKEQPERKGDKYVLTDIVLGEIVERVAEISVKDEPEEIDISDISGFPKPAIAEKKQQKLKGTSIFAQMMNKMKIDTGTSSKDEEIIDEPSIVHKNVPYETFIPKKESLSKKRSYPPPSMQSLDDSEIPSRRVLYDNSLASKIRDHVDKSSESDITKRLEKLKVSDPSPKEIEKNEIHKENLEILNKMTETDILLEKQNLLVSMDPELIKFLKTRSTKKKVEPKIEPKSIKMIDLPELELLKSKGSENWLNFNVVETEKLEWMKDINVKLEKLEPGTEFEARFDWNGILLPFSEKTPGEENPELFLHGEDPERAGYTIQEFFRLARSNVLQQRIAAFTAINGLLSIYNQGFYDNVSEFPISKIFFLLRFGLDDNIITLLELTTKGLASLFYNEADEALLDAIFDSAEGTQQPIPEMFSKSNVDDYESDIEMDIQLDELTNKEEKKESAIKMEVQPDGIKKEKKIDITVPEKILIDEDSKSSSIMDVQEIKKEENEIKLENDVENILIDEESQSAFKMDDQSDESENEKEKQRSIEKDRESDVILAEKNLVECLLGTNILSRIHYILNVIRPDNSTVISCIKILIQIARSGQRNAMKIVFEGGLIDCLIENFVTDLEVHADFTLVYHHPQPLVIKLLRIIASYSLALRLYLEKKDFFCYIKGYVYSRRDLDIKTIHLQIESLRYIRNFQQLHTNCDYYNEVLPALRFLLEWHYHYSEFTECTTKGHPLIRQHASAILSLLGWGNTIQFWSLFHDLLPLCLNKWFSLASKDGIDTGFSHYMMLSCSLDVATKILANKSKDINEFYEHYLVNFLMSKYFTNLCSDMIKQSTLLSQYFSRSSKLKSLDNFGSVVFADNKSGPSFIITEKYPFFLMTSLTKFIYHLRRLGKGDRIEYLALKLHLNEYLEKVSTSVNEQIKMNWFCTYEKRFLYRFLIYEAVHENLNSSLVVRLAYKLTTCFGKNSLKEINFLIDKILFNGKYFDANKLNAFKRAFLMYYSIKPKDTEFTNTVDNWSTAYLPVNWPYALNSVFYERIQTKEMIKTKLEDFDIVQTSLYYTFELEKYIEMLSPTNKLIYLMMPFFSKSFLDEDVKDILKICIKKFFDANKNEKFDFENTTVLSKYFCKF